MVSVTVIGEVVLDCFVTDSGLDRVPGGCAANEALALTRFGASVDLRARYSLDENGRYLKKFASDLGIDVSNCIDAAEPALVITITKDHTGHPTYNYAELLACADWQWNKVEIDKPLSAGCDGIIIGSMASVFPPGFAALFDWASQKKAAGVPVLYDLNVRPGSFEALDHAQLRAHYQQWIELADVIKVSDEDLIWWTPSLSAQESASLISTQGSSLVALTQGAQGVTMFSRGEQLFTFEPPPVEVVDTVGAGDTFMGWLAGGLLELPPDLRFDPALVLSVVKDAVYAAALNCGKTGCNPPTQADLVKFSG
jgi:fructokinase